jgi:hypothetical protein
MCTYTKILVGGLVVISPAIVALGVGAVFCVFLPVAAVGGVTGSATFNGKAIALQVVKLGKKLWREFF